MRSCILVFACVCTCVCVSVRLCTSTSAHIRSNTLRTAAVVKPHFDLTWVCTLAPLRCDDVFIFPRVTEQTTPNRVHRTPEEQDRTLVLGHRGGRSFFFFSFFWSVLNYGYDVLECILIYIFNIVMLFGRFAPKCVINLKTTM